jgi:hypothetical protein
MRLYSDAEETRIELEELIREWTQSGLLETAQGERLAGAICVELRRTNMFLRAGLALFTTLIIGASVALYLMLFDVSNEQSIAWVCFVAALTCVALAEWIVRATRCHRFGVEEALAVGAVVLLAIGGALTWSHQAAFHGQPEVAALTVGALGGFALYLRFGFVYAAVGAMACLACLPFRVDLPAALQHAIPAVLLTLVSLAARSRRDRHRDGWLGREYGILQAAAWAGVYFVLNVRISGRWHAVNQAFSAFTFACVWLLPAAGLWLALREKDRELLDANLVLALLTLVSSKAYLGWPRREWDPILLGALLMAIATAIRRWLSRGPHGQRFGFTPARLLESDRALVTLVGTVSAIAPPASAPPLPRPEPGFNGGRSGGGGAGGEF